MHTNQIEMTATQKQLLEISSNYTSQNCPIKYDILKGLCKLKSFDSTFNALLRQGYFERVETDDYSNQFKRTSKQST